ncbi:uncharacterized protein LOC124408699 [Diprion similis]|uniref:uncharacterized protein LOC124408699 n=1 Tax=Diprion similis TaxID=362088 RepID=UPI001EF8E0AA|nr:uncharacterized protein LOC124408699 [Diprion similis]
MSHDHIDAVKSCLDPEERRGVDVIVNISNPVFEYILENNASRLTEFFASGAFECINLQEFDACFYDDPTSSQSTEAIFNLTSDEPDLSKFAVDLRTCTTFETTKKCVIEVFDGCSLKRPSNFVRSVLDIAMAHSGCEAILEAHSAQATNQL